MGSEVYLCYKKSTAKTHFLAYKPGKLITFFVIVSLTSFVLVTMTFTYREGLMFVKSADYVKLLFCYHNRFTRFLNFMYISWRATFIEEWALQTYVYVM